MTPSLVEFREYFRYDPKTGKLFWKEKESKAHCIHVGREAGWIHKINKACYRYVEFKGREYKVHHIIWLLIHGRWPREEIDHINGDGLDNRLKNLREVSRQENSRNKRMSRNNATGITGISQARGGKYRAGIGVNYQWIYLGEFATIEDAIKARKAAECKYGFHPNHGRREPVMEGAG